MRFLDLLLVTSAVPWPLLRMADQLEGQQLALEAAIADQLDTTLHLLAACSS